MLFFVAVLLTLSPPASAQNSNLKWQRLPGNAIDIGLSHQGHMWAVGTDGFAYRWDTTKKTWSRYGQRNDFARIDAAADGSAVAVTEEGGVYYTNGNASGRTRWVQVGHRALDVGVGGGWVWITRADGDGRIQRARDDHSGDFNWQDIPGNLIHIDVDSNGNAWGVNRRNEVLQFVGGNWRKHTIQATEIGVGGDGTVWIVGTDVIEGRGGGTLFSRNVRSGRWVRDNQRLLVITAGPGGQPAGIDTLDQIWDKSARDEAPVAPGPSAVETGKPATGTDEGTTAEKKKPDPAMRKRTVRKFSGNWFRLPGNALDIGISHRGHIWVIGSDRFAYRWDVRKKSWGRHGNRQDFVHIDAADDGGALAVTASGDVYFTNGRAVGRGRWTKVGDKGQDVGIGGSRAWLTRDGGSRTGNQVWSASYDGSGRFTWRRLARSPSSSLYHIDGSPNGNAWGVTKENQIFRYDGEKWQKQNGEATDIGIGADSTVWIVGNDIVEKLGGGTLSQFDARARKWVKTDRRLRSVTAGLGGNPAGTDEAGEIWVRNFADTYEPAPNNLALGKAAQQSPQRSSRNSAAQAVDGNRDGLFRNGSVTDIRAGDNPGWLMVDLGAVYQIDAIRIYNRTDCCGARLDRAIVEISNDGEWESTDPTFSTAIKRAKQVNDIDVGQTGRFIRIRQTTRQALSVAEIEVFGEPKPVKPADVKVSRTKPQEFRLPAEWTKLAGTALDMGRSSQGHMWVIGTDGFAYRWNAEAKQWVRHGKRRDFVRIDAADDGGALAVAKGGGLFFTDGGSSETSEWIQLGGSTGDVGIGGGWVWITGNTNAGVSGLVARARYDGSGNFDWQRIDRDLLRIDVGKDGNAWAIDSRGDVYQFDDGNWRKRGNRKATDIGVDAEDNVWIVANDTDDAAGGGTLHRRDPVTGRWQPGVARLRTVTVGPNGHPAGTNSANEIHVREFEGGKVEQTVAGASTQAPETETAKISDLVGGSGLVPPVLTDIVVRHNAVGDFHAAGPLPLNGNPAHIVVYRPAGKTRPNIVVWHKDFRFSDYMPDSAGTPLDKVGNLASTSFLLVPSENAGTTIPSTVLAHLSNLGGNGVSYPAGYAAKAGTNLLAGFNTAQMPGITQITTLFRREPKAFLLAGTVDPSIFKTVKQTPDKPTLSPAPQAMAKLLNVYGETFLKNLVLEGQKLPDFAAGPLTYTDAKYEVSGTDDAILAGFEVSMEMEVAPPSGGTGPAGKVKFDGLRVDYDQGEKTVTLSGDIDADTAGKLVSYRGLTVETLSFEGVKPEGAPVSVTLDGSGKIDQKAAHFEINLEERNGKYEASLKLKGNLTLAELFNYVFKRGEIPGLDKIALTEVEIGNNYQAGKASLFGEDVRVAAFQPAGENTMVAIEHRALELANYIPQLIDTPVKKLGLGRSIFIITRDLKNPNGSDPLVPTLEVTKADRERLLPSYIVAMLDELEKEATGRIAGESVYPLTLRANGTTILSLFSTKKDQNAQQAFANEDAKKITDRLGIKPDTYVLKGFINKDMVRKAMGGVSNFRYVPPGLDIGFGLPAFQPPKTKGLITFSNSRIKIKEVDGDLETFVSTGLAIGLPGAGNTGLKSLDLVGKVRILQNADLEVELAATTQLAGKQVEETPFNRLKALNDPDADPAVSALVPTDTASQSWKAAFGIPFLTVEQVNVGASFTGSGATGPVSMDVGFQGVIEDRAPGQRLVLKGELLVTDNQVTDMALEIPGTVKVGALPGLNKIPGIKDLTFSDVTLSRTDMAGQMEGRGASTTGILTRDPDSAEYTLYLGARDLNLGVISSRIPATLGDFPIQNGVIVGSNRPTEIEVKVSDLPERAQPLFAGIVDKDADVTIVNGLGLFTTLEPGRLSDGNRLKKVLVSDMGLSQTLSFEGAIEDSGSSATPKVRLAATIPEYKIPGISEDLLKFTGTRMVLEDIDGLKASVEGEMEFKIQGQRFTFEDGKVSGAVDGTGRELQITGTSSATWDKAFGIPFLTLNSLELDATATRSDAGTDVDWGIKTESVLNKGAADKEQVFDANGQLLVENSAVADVVLEIPGEVKIANLPGIGSVPGINQFSFSDVKLSRYDVAAKIELLNTNSSVAKGSLSGIFNKDRDDGAYTLFAATENARLGHLSGKIPSTLADFPIQSGIIAISSQPDQDVKTGDLPDRVQPLFAGYFAEDVEITIVNGTSVFTRLDPNTLPDGNRLKTLLVKDMGLTQVLTFEGAVIDSQPATIRLATTIPEYKIPGISEDLLKFTGTRMVLENVDGLKASIEGEMAFKIQGRQFTLEDGKVSGAIDGTDRDLQITGTSSAPWEKAFGIPFLSLNRLELDATATRSDSGTDVDWAIKTASVLNKGSTDKEQIFDADGQLIVENGAVSDVVLEIPGEVKIGNLPGIGSIPGIDQFTFSDVKLSRYDIAVKVLWPNKTGSVAGVFTKDKDDGEYTLFAATENARLGDLSGNIPGALADFPIQNGIVAISSQSELEVKVGELPDRVQPLFAWYFAEDQDVTIVKGTSVFSKLEPDKLPDGNGLKDILVNDMGLKDPLIFEGAIIDNQAGANRVRLAAAIPTYKIVGIPEDILRFENSLVVISNDNGVSMALEGDMTFKAAGKVHELDGSVAYTGSDGDKKLTLEATSPETWDKPFGIPGLALSNIGLQVDVERGATSSTGFGITADAVFGGQSPTVEGQIAIADGKLSGASFTLLGTVDMNTVPGIQDIPGLSDFTFTDILLSKNLIADSVLIAGKAAWNRIDPNKQLDAAFIEKDGTFALLTKMDRFAIGQLSTGMPAPISDIGFPKSVVAISNQEFDAFEVEDLPESVRNTLFDDVIGETTKQKIKISKGLTVLARLGPADMPTLIRTPMEDILQIKDPVLVAGTIGGVFGGPASAALYAEIPKAVVPGGDVLKKMLNFRDLSFFIRTNAGAASQMGLSGAMDFKVPHLDDPKTSDTLDLTGEMYMDLGPGAPGVEVAGKMTGRWENPMGLNDFTFEDTEIKVGVNADGSVDVGIGGQAEFKSRKDGLVYYALDLMVGIIPPVVPNKLAVQFVGKKKVGDALVDGASIGPVVMMEMSDSLFRGVLAGGMADQVIKQVQPAAARSTARKLQDFVKSKSMLDIVPLDRVPLPLLSVRDPLIYFSTPGAGLPPRPGIPAPTLGLGVLMNGTLDFTLLGARTELANADMRLTLNDGLKIIASVPSRTLGPAKIEGNIDVHASLTNIGSAYFKTSGFAGLSGTVLDVLGASASYDLAITQSGTTVSMAGTARAGPIDKRSLDITVSPTSVRVTSPASCRMPFPITANASFEKDNFQNFDFTSLKPSVGKPDPTVLVGCAQDVYAILKNGVVYVFNGTEKLAEFTEEHLPPGLDKLPLSKGVRFAGGAMTQAEDLANDIASKIPGMATFTGFISPGSIGEMASLVGQSAEEIGSALGATFTDPNKAARDAAKKAEATAKVAVNAVNVTGEVLKSAADFVPSNVTGSAEKAARAVFDTASKALNSAVEALENIGCRVVGWTGACGKRKRRLANERANAERRLFDAAVALSEFERAKRANASNAIYDVVVEVYNNELKKQTARADLNRARQKLVNSGPSAASCDHGTYWNIQLGQCWSDGFTLVTTKSWADKTTTKDLSKCLASDSNGRLWKDWCTTSSGTGFRTNRNVRFKFENDGTIRTPGGRCLGTAAKPSASTPYPEVLALNCSGAPTQQWRFDLKGRINAGDGLCITEFSWIGKSERNLGDGLHLFGCDQYRRDKPLEWRPLIGTVNYRAQKGIPDTAMLDVGNSGYCVDAGAGYRSPPVFGACDPRNLHQFFATGFVDENHFVLASRTAKTCLDASAFVDQGGGPIVNNACVHSESQQFSMAGSSDGKVQFKNRRTGLCLAVAGAAPGTGVGLSLENCGSGRNQSFGMNAIADIKNQPAPPRPLLGKAETRIELQSAYMDLGSIKTYHFNLASQPGSRMVAESEGHAKLIHDAIPRLGYGKFQVLLGLYAETGAVSLQSVGQSPQESHRFYRGGFHDRARFLRRSGNAAIVSQIKGGTEFSKNASFWIVKGLSGARDSISFESVAAPGSYIYRQGQALMVGPGAGPAFHANATFRSQQTNN